MIKNLPTRVLKIEQPTPEQLRPAAETLREGGLVAFPTETVYGLGAIFNDETALLKIFAVKGRPADNPLIVHIFDVKQLKAITPEVSLKAQRLITAFWPGPLTIIFPKLPEVPSVVTAGLDTVAVRMPSHPVAHELLRLTEIPVAAPSANLSGRPSPTRGSHVIADLQGRVDLIIDAGPCQKGVESTVLSLATLPEPTILRPGSVTKEMLEQVLGESITQAELGENEKPQAPGMKYRHYAPQAPVVLVEGLSSVKIRAEIHRLLALEPDNSNVVIIATTENLVYYSKQQVLDLGPGDSPEIAATRLYDLLRLCDQLEASKIFIEGVVPIGVGAAVCNRLRKAAGGNVIHVS